jgi:hypothetical protein
MEGRYHWSDDALCTGLHSEMWFPPLFKDERSAPESQYYELGKLVCDTCPVREQCAEAGAEEEYGMWGGQTPKDRRNGVYKPPKTYLPMTSVSLMPRGEGPLDVESSRQYVRTLTKRRPRKPKTS